MITTYTRVYSLLLLSTKNPNIAQRILEENPKVNFSFSTVLEYKV